VDGKYPPCLMQGPCQFAERLESVQRKTIRTVFVRQAGELSTNTVQKNVWVRRLTPLNLETD